MDGAVPNVFERIEQKLSGIGIEVDNSDLRGAEKQVEANLEKDPSDMESKLARLELKVVELARFLDAAVSALEARGAQPVHADAPVAAPVQQAPRQQAAVRRIKKLQQNPATGVIEEVEVEDNPADHFIVADGHGGFGGHAAADSRKEKKSVFIAAADDEPVSSPKK